MGKEVFTGPLEQVDACCYRIPKSYKQGMRVDGLIFANETLMQQLKLDQAPEQVANVAFLPGIQMASLAMPDIHWGYGFCIGGVCATDPDEGRRHLPRRRRLRHQLRRSAHAFEPLLPRGQAASATTGRYALPRNSDRRRQVGPVYVSRSRAGPPSVRGIAVSRRQGPGHARRHRLHRSAWPARRGRSRSGQRSCQAAWRRAVRHARLRQSLPGGAGRRLTSSTRTPPACSAWKRT